MTLNMPKHFLFYNSRIVKHMRLTHVFQDFCLLGLLWSLKWTGNWNLFPWVKSNTCQIKSICSWQTFSICSFREHRSRSPASCKRCLQVWLDSLFIFPWIRRVVSSPFAIRFRIWISFSCLSWCRGITCGLLLR